MLDRIVAALETANNAARNEAITPPKSYRLPNDNDDAIPKGRALAHHHLRVGNPVFVSFDIETGGDFYGILQLSAEIAQIELLLKTTAKGGGLLHQGHSK